MKPAALLLILALAAPLYAHGQASEIPSAQQTLLPGQTQEQRGRILLDQMVAALGGDAWLHRKDMTVRGRTAAFFRGAPNGYVVEYSGNRQFAQDGKAEAERIGFITDKSMILPGKKIDIVQVWVDNQGYEVTFKGCVPLPKEQVEDYFRRRDHSIEAVIRIWLKQPGVIVIAEGTSMVERRLADKVSVLSANNDAVTIELDASTHLPLRRTFQWRNTQFKDHDEDAEQYDGYQTFQGLPTAMTLTRYHNGDMASQRFFSKVEYNSNLSPDLFNPDKLLKKKQ
ncbi:MAG: hypothetical protein JWM43_2957 [Acidobacteriaceae bacterium]|nr:hypothetical protein [Acidobacteriaceae bacterium]